MPAPKKSLGQNWLRSAAARDKILRAMGPIAGENVVEIGPGEGFLTAAILRENPKNLVAVELDPRCAGELRERFLNVENFFLTEADCRETPLPPGTFAPQKNVENFVENSAAEPWILVGNLPYYLSSHFLIRVAGLANPPARAVFLLQKEVAEKCAAPKSAGGRLGVFVGNAFAARLAGAVPARAFFPPPRVESAVLRLDARPAPLADPEIFKKVLAAGFAARRKTLGNNFRAVPRGAEILAAAGVEPGRRAEDLEISEWVEICKHFG